MEKNVYSLPTKAVLKMDVCVRVYVCENYISSRRRTCRNAFSTLIG